MPRAVAMRRVITIAVLVWAVGGCAGEDQSDLKEFFDNAHKDRKPRIEPLPEMKPQEVYTYAATESPDPFSQSNLKAQAVAAGKAAGPRPDMNRRREPLEEFPLDGLRMVGTISRGKQFWAIVRAPDSTVHRIQAGNHLGQNFGQVTKVTEDRVELIELIQTGLGEWVEREASLSLAD